MRMIDLELEVDRRKPFHSHLPTLRLRSRSRSGHRVDSNSRSHRSLYPKPSAIPRPVRSLLSTVTGDVLTCGSKPLISDDLDMERGPSILESPMRNALLSSFFEYLRPRRDLTLTSIRRARMAQEDLIRSSSLNSSISSTSEDQDLSSNCRIIPIEIRDTPDAVIAKDVEILEKPSQGYVDSNCVIEIADDERSPASESEGIVDLGRKSLFQKKPQENQETDSQSKSCIKNTSSGDNSNISSQSSSGIAKGKEILIGGANKCHPPPDDAVLVLDDIGHDPGVLKPKDLAQCQGTSGLGDELAVNGAPAYPVYISLKEKLAKECRQIDYIRGDGNCFFRAVSKQLYESERFHKTIRNLIVDLIATNKSSFAQFVDGEDVQDHVERMCQEQSWATTCEIYAAATLLQRDIYMLTPDHLNETYSWLLFKPMFQCDAQESGIMPHPCYLTMCNTNGNHYDRIVPEHGGCNCFLPHPELDGVSYTVDLTKESS